MNTNRPARCLALVLTLVLLSGCVERTVRFDTRPSGAVIVVNDEELPDVTPAKTSFLWYGDYDIIVRKPGYKTLKTHVRLERPWYEYPPIDIIAECFVLGTIRDEHVVAPFELEPAEKPETSELVDRAVNLRIEAHED
ncbi:MAG: PEGA domain-containing protein [Phycisphaerae bacterium]|nr:PEGA domain-containing protein [Phycisphaerae bacterium]